MCRWRFLSCIIPSTHPIQRCIASCLRCWWIFYLANNCWNSYCYHLIHSWCFDVLLLIFDTYQLHKAELCYLWLSEPYVLLLSMSIMTPYVAMEPSHVSCELPVYSEGFEIESWLMSTPFSDWLQGPWGLKFSTYKSNDYWRLSSVTYDRSCSNTICFTFIAFKPQCPHNIFLYRGFGSTYCNSLNARWKLQSVDLRGCSVQSELVSMIEWRILKFSVDQVSHLKIASLSSWGFELGFTSNGLTR